MSVNHYMYIGAYLVVVGKEIEVDGRTVCSRSDKHKFNVFHDTKFCPSCGAPVKIQKEKGYRHFYDIDDEIKIPKKDRKLLMDSFFPIGMESLEESVELLGVTVKGVFFESLEENEDFVELTIESTTKKDVEEKLSKHIQLLKKYLYDSVEVRIGYISTYG